MAKTTPFSARAGLPPKTTSIPTSTTAQADLPVAHTKGKTKATDVPDAHLGAGLESKVGATPVGAVVDTSPGKAEKTAIALAGPKDTYARQIMKAIETLPAMDRAALRHKFHRPTTRMATFLANNFGKKWSGNYVGGKPQFTVGKLPKSPKHVFEYRDFDFDEVKASQYYTELGPGLRAPIDQDYTSEAGDVLPKSSDGAFKFTKAELTEWQDSARAYYAPHIYTPDVLSEALKGEHETPDEVKDKKAFDAAVGEAFKAKWVVKMGKMPIICNSSGEPLSRSSVDQKLPTIWMGSQCGMDLDFRTHDRQDTLQYVTYSDGSPISDDDAAELERLRDNALGFANEIHPHEAGAALMKCLGSLTLDKEKMLAHAVQMKKLYMEAQVDSGIQVPVVVAMGCGVFARWFPQIPDIMAEADKQVLSDPQWRKRGIRGVVYALPRFSGEGDEPYERFSAAFQKSPPKNLPVVFADQDALTITRALADSGYEVSVMNPADSDLAAGEYWENRGPALEEWFALTTGMLLSQHAVINPKVTDKSTFKAVELVSP